MQRFLIALLIALLGSDVSAQQFGFQSAPGVTLQDEGTDQGRALKLNCVGAGISCSVSASTGTLTVAGGSANFLEASLTVSDTSAGGVYTVTVTGQAWVTSSSKIVCSVFADGTGSTPIEIVFVSGQTWIVTNRVAGTGFDLTLYNPYGATGTFKAHCTGA